MSTPKQELARLYADYEIAHKQIRELAARDALLLEAIAILREVDKSGVLSTATRRGAGNFVRAYDAVFAARALPVKP